MQPFRALVTRVRALPPRVLDAGLAALLLVEGLAELFLLTPIEGVDLAIGAIVGTVMTVMRGT